MRHAIRCLLALLGCLHLAGGVLGILQLLAWSSMLVDYSQQDGLLVGARKTFDGQHPCELCRAIEEERQREEPRQQQVRDGDWKPVPLPHAITLAAPTSRVLAPHGLPTSDLPPPGRGPAPPLPPPRRAS